MKLSILTASYNRGNLLGNLYKSILDNLYDKLDIEWLIMDDGSVDNTENIVKQFTSKEHLEIKYFKQKNQGKMQAINNLIKYATGELIMDCDSDDHFINNAFEEIYNKKDILLKDDELYGLVFLKNENKDQLSGNEFKKENLKTTMFDLYFKDTIVGEKMIVFKSDIRKQYKHQLENKEKFITEARMYHKMDLDYKIKCFNIIIVEGEYLKNGYTSNINQTFIKCPNGYFNYFKEILERNMKGVTFKKRMYVIKHYILFSYLANTKTPFKYIKGYFNKILFIIFYIPGRYKSKTFYNKEEVWRL